MSRVCRQSVSNSPARHAVTLVETLVSITLVGVLLVAALDLLAASARGQKGMGDQGRAQLLALDLMSEILPNAYEDPDGAADLGPDIVDEDPFDRQTFDDVDDYDGWSASPPKAEDATPIPNLTGWQRSVFVEYVDPTNTNLVLEPESDAGVKRITVTVLYNGAPMATIVAVRTNAL